MTNECTGTPISIQMSTESVLSDSSEKGHLVRHLIFVFQCLVPGGGLGINARKEGFHRPVYLVATDRHQLFGKAIRCKNISMSTEDMG
jgi:hypothetical protein